MGCCVLLHGCALLIRVKWGEKRPEIGRQEFSRHRVIIWLPGLDWVVSLRIRAIAQKPLTASVHLQP